MLSAGGIEQLAGLTLNGVTASFPVLSTVTGSITASNVAVGFPALTKFDGAGFSISGGAVVSLPALQNVALGCNANWSVSGDNSILEMPGLTNLTAFFSFCSETVEATGGGQIDAGNLSTLTVSIAYGGLLVLADGSDSIIDLSRLINYQPAALTLSATNGGAILLPQFADLSVKGFSVPATAVIGQAISLVYTLTNNSVTAIGPWQNQFFLAANLTSTNVQDIGTVWFTNSIVGHGFTTLTQSVILPASAAGSYYIGVTANSDAELPEQTRTNNTAYAAALTVISGPDLALIQMGAPGSAQLGQSIEVTFAVTNIGSAPATAAWNDQLYLSSSPNSLAGAALLATLPGTSPLIPGAGYARSQSVTLPLSASSSPGNYYIVGLVDGANAQIEMSKANNLLSRPIALSLPPLPDLAVAQVMAPSNAVAGQFVSLNWSVTNQGGLSITNGSWTEAAGLTNASGAISMLAAFRYTNSLNAASFLTRTQVVLLPGDTSAGAVTFFVTVNSLGDIVESNTTNNTTFPTNLTVIPFALSLMVPLTNVLENTSSPNLSGLVSRNGNLALPVTISLASSATNHLVVPASIIIPAGAPSAPFTAMVLDDGIADPNAWVVITAQASGYLSDTTQVMVVNTDVPHLSLSLSSPQISQGQSAMATVTSDTVFNQPVTVTVSSSTPSALAAPASVVIPAGSNSVVFNLTASPSTVLAPPQTYSVTVAAPGFAAASTNLTVLNINTPTLTLSLARTNISEADGPLAAIATVSRQPVTDQPLAVALASSNPAAALVPAQAIIPALQGNASFYVAAVADTNISGPKLTLITAQALDISSNAVGNEAVEALAVQDANGPMLTLALANKVAAKGLAPATTGLVSRNTPPTNDLVVSLTCSAPAEATVPVTVTIPSRLLNNPFLRAKVRNFPWKFDGRVCKTCLIQQAASGQTNVSFSVTSLDDGVPFTSQTVSVAAGATNYASASVAFAVTDLQLPDLVIASVTAPGAAFTGQPVTLYFRLANQGLAALTSNVNQSIFLTTNPSSGANQQVGTVAFPGPLAPGQYVDLSLGVPASSLPPPGDYWVLVTANADGATAESNTANDTGISAAPMVVGVEYTAQVQAGVATVPAGTPVPLFGSATLIQGGPATNAQVNLIITVNGLPRIIGVYTDANGNFSTIFTPLAVEAGSYTVTAVAPGVSSGPAQAQFNILGMTANPAFLALAPVAGGSASAMVSLQNLSAIPLTGLTATVSGLAANLNANATLSTNVVGAQSVVTLGCTVMAADSSVPQSGFNIRVASDEGATLDLPVTVMVTPLLAHLVVSPAQLSASMLVGGQSVVQFYVANLGGAVSGPLILAAPNVPWLHVASASPLPSLSPGQSNLVTLALTPATNLALGPYAGSLAINGSGLGIQVPFVFDAVSDAHGSWVVQTVDELTFFANGSPPLTNAIVTLTDPVSQSVVASGVTGTNGLFETDGLLAGAYQLAVVAPQHAPFHGTAVVTAGQTNTIQAFLSLQTVSYTWTVVPTQIQGQAQITIQATFQANVPAPVVVPSPTSLDVSSLTQPDQFMDVPLTLANYGLIAVNNVTLAINSGQYYRFDVITPNLGTLPAHGSVTVPMRITLVSTPASSALASPKSGNAGGANPRPLDAGASPCISVSIAWTYPCGGYNIGQGVPISVFNAVGDCGASGGGIIVTGGAGGGAFVIPPDSAVPSTCDPDPCVLKRLLALAKCVLDFIDLPNEAAQCFRDGYQCGTSLQESCIKDFKPTCGVEVDSCLFDALGCGGKLGKAFVEKFPWIGWALTAISCSYDVCTACEDLGYEGTCGTGGPPTPGLKPLAKKDSVAVGQDAAIIFAPLLTQASDLQTVIAPYLYFFNNNNWFSVADTNALETLLDQFGNDIQTNSDGAQFITAAESASLRALPLPAPLSPSDLDALINRWNLTSSNYAAGVFSINQVPPGGDTNFIDFTNWVSLLGAAVQKFQTYNNAGYTDPGAAWFSTRNSLLSAYEHGESGVCAQITLQLDQSAVLTLNAFHATLQLNNNSANSLSNVTATLVVQNQAGQDVTSLFSIQPPAVTGGLAAVDGSGSLASGQSGSAQWTLIPTAAAAPQAATNYLVSGTLSYAQGGVTVTIPLAPAAINVQPTPQLYLKYFLQRDVFADDPYTPEIEPWVPFPLAVMVENQGYGAAYDFQITSAQPQIVDNQKGLLISFDIIGAQVGTQPAAPSLTVNFGDVLPAQIGIGIWYLTSTLEGEFISYSASFQNTDPLGNTSVSDIDGVEIHQMTHMVRADGGWDDGLPDFLVNDIPNLNVLPDTLYLSGGNIEPVSVVQSASTGGPVTSSNLQLRISADFPAGFTYVLVPDPADGQFPLQAVLYANGTNFLTNNFWTTDRTFIGLGQPPLLQNNLHLFAYHTNAGPDTFTLI
jgi:hypothetical protein